MIVALYIFVALLAVGAVLKLTDRPSENAPEKADENARPQEECCGMHLVCERVGDISLADKIEYFDDEELDEFAGRSEADYSDEETDRFRDVLLTLPPGEAAPWARSLERRGIALPASLRDELLMLVEG